MIVWAAVPAPAADPASLVPGDTLLYLGWSAQSEPCPLLALAEASVHAPLVTKEIGDGAAAFQKGLAIIEACRRHDGTFVLLGPKLNGDYIVSQLGLVVAAGPAAPALASAFAAWAEVLVDTPDAIGSTSVDGVTLRQAALHPDHRLLWTVHKDHFIAAADEAAVRRLLAVLDGHGPTLAENAEFRAARAQVQPATTGGTVTAYADVAVLVAAFKELAAADTADTDPPADVTGALGLDAFKSAFLHLDRINDQSRMTAFVHVEGARGLAKLYKQAPLADDDLRVVPQDAFWAVVWKLDLAALWQEALRVIEQLKPDVLPTVEGGLAFAAQFLGFSLTDELLPALGDAWALYDAPAHGGFLITGIVAVGQARDPEAVERMVSGLIERLSPLAATKQIRLERKELRDGPHTVHYLLIGGYPIPVAPAWGFVGQRCVVGLFPQTVAVAMRQADPQTRGPSLLDQPDYKAARPLLPEKLTSVGYADARQSHRTWYALKHLALTAVASLSAGTPQAFDLAAVPTYPQELKEVRNTVWGCGADEHGVIYRGFGSSAASLLIGSDPSGLATVALTTSILLPSLSRAREIAKRAVSAANLRGIGQACFIYANEHDGRFPPQLADLLPDGRITEKMLHSPRDDLPDVSYVYIAGQKFESRPTNILAYERLIGDEGTNVLFIDGHVEWMKVEAFRSALRETYERLNRAADLPKEFRD
jgi:prepilin-type processing-associated H-X9-DG protein